MLRRGRDRGKDREVRAVPPWRRSAITTRLKRHVALRVGIAKRAADQPHGLTPGGVFHQLFDRVPEILRPGRDLAKMRADHKRPFDILWPLHDLDSFPALSQRDHSMGPQASGRRLRDRPFHPTIRQLGTGGPRDADAQRRL